MKFVAVLIQREEMDICLRLHALHVRRGSSTGDNFDQFPRDDCLSGSVVQNLVPADHVTSILGGVLRIDQRLVTPGRAALRREIDLHPWHFGEQTVRRRGPRQEPRTASWPGCTRGGC